MKRPVSTSRRGSNTCFGTGNSLLRPNSPRSPFDTSTPTWRRSVNRAFILAGVGQWIRRRAVLPPQLGKSREIAVDRPQEQAVLDREFRKMASRTRLARTPGRKSRRPNNSACRFIGCEIQSVSHSSHDVTPQASIVERGFANTRGFVMTCRKPSRSAMVIQHARHRPAVDRAIRSISEIQRDTCGGVTRPGWELAARFARTRCRGRRRCVGVVSSI
jgi:hypothetical protein